MFEVEDLPKRHAKIQQTETGDRAPHPARRHKVLQSIEPSFTGGIKQKVVVAPITQTQETLRNPRQKGQDNANFQAKDNVKNDAELGRHGRISIQ